MHKVSQVIGISFLYYLSSLEPPLLLSSSSYHTEPNTRKERAIYHPHKRPRPRLRPKQPCELPCNMHAHVTCISNHVLRLRARRSELRVRSLVSGSLFLEIYLSRACAGVGFWGECIRFSEQP